jgi:hypothetical protein
LGPTYIQEQIKIAQSLGETLETGKENFEAYGVPEDVAPLVVYLVSEQAKYLCGCIFEIHSNYVAIYDNPTQKTRIMSKKGGRFTSEELETLLPLTLTEGEQLPKPMAPKKENMNKLAPGAKGWLWADGKLTEVPPN